MVDGVHTPIKNPALKENRRLLYRMAEISVISQKFLFSHIQNFIPNIFCIHHFSISEPHHGDLSWGPPLRSSNTSNYHLSIWHDMCLMGIVPNLFLACENTLLMKYVIPESIFDIPDIWVRSKNPYRWLRSDLTINISRGNEKRSCTRKIFSSG